MTRTLIAAALCVVLPCAAWAQDTETEMMPPVDEAAIAAATAAGVCEFGVATAVYTAESQISATCLTEDATAFVPLVGGLAPAIAVPVVAAVAAVAGAGDGGSANGTTN